MTKIFISYRRDDSPYLATTLNDSLRQQFGADSVFFDIDHIPLGVDFRAVIGQAVGQCDVLLVLIGDNWVVDRQGQTRLDKPSDYVRIEIESALKRDIPVVPILVGNAMMPAPDALPESIQDLVFRNATEIRAGRDMHQHINWLIQSLRAIPGVQVLKQPEAPEEPEEPATMEPPAPTPRPAAEAAALAAIHEALEDYHDGSLFLAPDIPARKLNNALAKYMPGVHAEQVLLLYDNTVFGGAADGLSLTADTVYWHNILEEPRKFRYEDVKRVKNKADAADVQINGLNISVAVGDNTKALGKALVRAVRRMQERARGQ